MDEISNKVGRKKVWISDHHFYMGAGLRKMRSREGLRSRNRRVAGKKSAEATVALQDGQQGEVQPILHLTLPR